MGPRSVLRGAITLAAIACFVVHGSLVEISMSLMEVGEGVRQRSRANRTSSYSRFILRWLGFEVEAFGQEAVARLPDGFLIVCNHVSFWDMFVISSRVSPVYVTSMEVRDTPILGWIARLCGAIFVERRNRTNVEGEVDQVAATLARGIPVGLFPEATSSNGDRVLPFKRSFFRAALVAGVPVVPACLNYLSVDGARLDVANREALFYYGDQTIFPKLAKIFAVRSVRVELRFLAPIRVEDGATRESLCESAYHAVTANHRAPLSMEVS